VRSFPLEENEQVLDMEYVQLKAITHEDNRKAVMEDELPIIWKPYLVVGTAYQLGEDQLVTGRVGIKAIAFALVCVGVSVFVYV
jgi:hypothetical protein